MMKKLLTKHQAAPLLTALVLGLLSSCPNLVDQPNPARSPGEGLAQISLVTAEEDAFPPERTILPRPSDMYYTLEFTKGGTTTTKHLDKAASIGVSLAEGTWGLAVRGYSDSARNNQTLGGNATITINSGEATPVTVRLSPYGTPSGNGSIAYTIKFPDTTGLDINSGTLSINRYGDGSNFLTIDLLAQTASNSYSVNDGVATAAGTIYPVPAGYYQALIKLSAAADLHAGYTALLHVYNDAITPATREFDERHFLQAHMVDAYDLTGLVVRPARGAAPVATAPDTAQYGASIGWQDAGGTPVGGNFAASTVYRAVVTLTAKDGLTFDGVGANVFSYSGIEASKVTSPAGTGAAMVVTIEFPATAALGLYYVKTSPAGLEDGSSWDNASDDLQAMIDAAGADKLENNSITAIVRVAAGTYKPRYAPAANGDSVPETGFVDHALSHQDRTFILRPGVEIRGGYTAAGENIDESARKARFGAAGEPASESYRAVLSGDIDNTADGGNARDGFTGMVGNARHVVLGKDIPGDGKTALDGFTIKGSTEGGIHNTFSSPVLTNLTITGNSGGGIYNSASSPVLTNATIAGNSAAGITSGAGGGIYNGYVIVDESNGPPSYHRSSPVLANVAITGNTAASGGGIYNSASSPVLTNVAITGNFATGNSTHSEGGGIYNDQSSLVLTNVVIAGNSADSEGGGIYTYAYSSLILTNVVIAGNTAAASANGSGGGISNSLQSSLVLTNVTITGNQAFLYSGGGMTGSLDSSSKIRNSIIWGNSSGFDTAGAAEVFYSIVQGGWTGAGSGNRDIDPLFASPQNYSAAPTIAGDYHLLRTSPAINMGDNNYYPDTWAKWQAIETLIGKTILDQPVYETYVQPALAKDAGGADRPVPVGSIDLGAYEEPGGVTPNAIILLTLTDEGDGAFSEEMFQLSSGSKTVTVTGTWDDPPGARWFVDGAQRATESSITINAADYQAGWHFLSLWVEKDGKPWSKSIYFSVGN
jgi:hypothetical protein